MNQVQTISAFPNADLHQVLFGGTKHDPLLSLPRVYTYASGRAALYRGMQCLALPGDASVLVPDYHCGVEVEAITRAGLQVLFYKTGKDLSIDFTDLRQRLNRKVSVLMVIHYFGFPQPVQEVLEFCKEHKLILIEDCAHALYSKWQDSWLGTIGDMAVFSLQKTYAMPNGGALLLNRPDISSPKPGRRHMELALLKSSIRSILEHESRKSRFVGKLSQSILKAYTSEESSDCSSQVDEYPPTYYHEPRFHYTHAIWGLSARFMKGQDPYAIIRKRRDNYNALGALLGDLNHHDVCTYKLPDRACPLCFPVFVPKRDEIVRELHNRGVYTFVFGRSPHPALNVEEHPESHFLSDSQLGLPVHQQLTDDDMIIVAETFRQTLRLSKKVTTLKTTQKRDAKMVD
ncbi:MAG: aminotransferase class V-fold PLP-dependent enzyme [bacterium]